jgi:hypothetical protein
MHDTTDHARPNLPAPPPARRTAPDDVWAQVRDAYVAGLSAPGCRRLYGVGLTALHQRAAREGWRRVDQPWTPPNRLDPDDEGVALEEETGGDLDRIELCQLTFVAHRRMLRAVMRGDAVEALRWRRVRLVMDAEEAEMDRLGAQQQALFAARREGADPVDAVDAVDAADPVDPVDPVGVFRAAG